MKIKEKDPLNSTPGESELMFRESRASLKLLFISQIYNLIIIKWILKTLLNPQKIQNTSTQSCFYMKANQRFKNNLRKYLEKQTKIMIKTKKLSNPGRNMLQLLRNTFSRNAFKFYPMIKNPMNKKILLAIPCYSGEINDHVRKALDEMIVPEGYEVEEKVILRTMIHTARNFAVKLALNGNFDYLLFCDDDNAPEKDALQLLLEADKDIIGGLIRGRQFPHKLCIFDQQPDKHGFREYIQMQRVPIVPDDVFEVANMGTGFVLYKREVLETMWEEYNHYPFEFKVAHYIPLITGSRVELEKAYPKFLPIFRYEDDNSIKIIHFPISEDLLFHERCRYYNFKIFAHRKVCLKHYDTDGTFYSVNDEENVDGCNDDL